MCDLPADPQLESFGARFAVPGISEKGYVNTEIFVESPGGHSSVPPPHTTIGLLALIIVHLEKNPYPAHLTRTSPLYALFQCQAEHAPDFPIELKEVLEESLESDEALRLAEELIFASEGGYSIRVQLSTTQAVVIIEGGVKVNALPEQASAFVNQRIATER